VAGFAMFLVYMTNLQFIEKFYTVHRAEKYTYAVGIPWFGFCTQLLISFTVFERKDV
jgi:hypothetical protein